MFYSILFCVCLITANVLETKQISLGPANMTAGLIVFPVSYIINDVVCEAARCGAMGAPACSSGSASP